MRKILSALLLCIPTAFAAGPMLDFWSAYDARKEPLEVQVVKAWEDDVGHYQLVRYRVGKLVGSNKSASPIMAAYYGYPKDVSGKVPGIVHIHGGGQRASRQRVADWVKLGYGCVSINWGGKVLEETETTNTDWDGLAGGFERPGASKADGLLHYNMVKSGPNTLHKELHLLNSSWNLIVMSARRALTFLEQAPQVDGERLGVEGHSMGGRSTVLTAIDPRIKAASPSVGGSGFLYQDIWGLAGSARRMTKEDGLGLYTKVVSAQSYWPYITAPVMFLQGANDFNAPTDLVVKGMSLLPATTEQMLAIAPHLNHRFTTETAAARVMWMEAHLKGSFSFPKRSRSALELNTSDGVPVFRLVVDHSTSLLIRKVEIYYGYARDPRIRFWRSAKVKPENEGVYLGKCPVFDVAEPLFAFANITYQMPRTLPSRPGKAATDLLTVSSEYQIAYPEALKTAGTKTTEKRERLIDDFSRGWQDWYRLNQDNPHHWFYSTRKILDPSWIGPNDGRLAVELEITAPGCELAVGVEVNNWQGYTGRKRDTYHAVIELANAGPQSISLRSADFKNWAGQSLADWDEITELFFTPANRLKGINGGPPRKRNWNGRPLELKKLSWVGGQQIPRLHPHQIREGRKSGTVAFTDEFQKAIDDSVVLEQMDDKAATSKDGRVYLTQKLASKIESFVRVNDDKAWAGGVINVGNKHYGRGLGVHADSKLTFPLCGKFKTFHVVPGPDNAHRGQLEMKILVDGKEIFTTGPTTSHNHDRQPLIIPVVGANSLTLIVESLGEKGGDHASWADAYLVR
jgi:dienelactone hydrolase